MSDDSFSLYDLSVSVTGKSEDFVCSHKSGHAFDVVGENLVFSKNNQFSMYALATLLPFLPAKQRTTHKNDWMTTDAFIDCPDPHCKAQFEIRRKDKKTTFSHAEVTKVPLGVEGDSV